ncbi:ABC transporter ATP-binding protein [Actinomadura sp. ATCC 39365]
MSVSVEQGEMLALLGPSGCGKTTLLRCIAGLTGFDGGRLTIGGADMAGVPVRKRPIGMVFQSYALFPNLTVGGNVAFPLTVRKRPKEEVRDRVAEMLDLVGLDHLADRLPNQLSGGQQQRVALARALSPVPRCCCWTSPCPPWTPRYATACATRCAASSTRSASPPSSSPTTRPRPWPSPTGSR